MMSDGQDNIPSTVCVLFEIKTCLNIWIYIDLYEITVIVLIYSITM